LRLVTRMLTLVDLVQPGIDRLLKGRQLRLLLGHLVRLGAGAVRARIPPAIKQVAPFPRPPAGVAGGLGPRGAVGRPSSGPLA